MVDTDDLVQETLLSTARHVERFEQRHDGALLDYMRTALRNRIRDELRRAGRRPTRADELPETWVAPDPSPLEQTIGQQTLDRYDQALAGLDPATREAVVCRVELGMSYRQIAAALAKPSVDAARMAVTRALVRLAREMDDAEV